MVEKYSSEVSKFESVLSPRSPYEFIALCILTVAINILSNAIGGGVIIALSSVVVIALFIIWWVLYKSRIKRRSEQVGFSIVPMLPLPARGLILLVGPYDPLEPTLKKDPKLRELIDYINETPDEALSDKDFEAINLFNSKLQPQIEAVKFHADNETLRDVWLITTETVGKNTGSEEAGMILEKYLQFKYDKQITIHRKDFCLKHWDYATLFEKAEVIFRTSGYKDEVIIADITGGTKMMSVALAMACIPPNRRMQYMSSDRDWQGNPIPGGQLKPLVIDVDPILYHKQ